MRKIGMAELFLRLLVKHHPAGVSTAFAAKKLYGSASDRNKRKIYR